ncbi:MAG: glycosyltransferase [Oscillospiraceae bacterium]
MVSITLCMIVKNEELTIERCLSSVKGIADEIIIVDTGSIDKTKDIAAQFTDQIYSFEWIDDFSAARNYSFSKATKEYILWLDADDVILPADRDKFITLKQNLNPDVDVVIMRYHIGKGIDEKSICSFPRERLLKRSGNFIWYDCVHEYLILKGNIINVDIGITHKSNHGISVRNLNILEKQMREGKTLSNRQTFYYARELFLNGRFREAKEQYEKFLITKDGLVSNYMDACLDLSYCYQVDSQKENQLKTLLRSFEYAVPRGEICCRIGYYYKESDNYERAIEWFELATLLKKPDGNTTSVVHDFWGYIPCMELCICNFKLKKYSYAKRYNEMAGFHRPNDSVYLYNRELLKDF